MKVHITRVDRAPLLHTLEFYQIQDIPGIYEPEKEPGTRIIVQPRQLDEMNREKRADCVLELRDTPRNNVYLTVAHPGKWNGERFRAVEERFEILFDSTISNDHE